MGFDTGWSVEKYFNPTEPKHHWCFDIRCRSNGDCFYFIAIMFICFIAGGNSSHRNITGIIIDQPLLEVNYKVFVNKN